MQKYKPIAKNYEHRSAKPTHKDVAQPTSDSDSQEELFERLLQTDSECRQLESSPIELLAYQHEERDELYYQSPQESPCEDEEADQQYLGGSNALSRINAEYARKMGMGLEVANSEAVVRFESTIRVKFFSEEQPVAEVGSAQEYITSFNQYYQTSSSDEDNKLET